MRLFAAITPPAAALAELDLTAAALRPAWPQLRWTGTDAWHVTLAFLGEVAEPKLDGLRERLERAARRHHATRLRVGKGGAFPSAGKARVFCAFISGEPAALMELRGLAGSVAAGARRAGAPPPDEGRRYRPHVTLARCSQPVDLRPLVEALSGYSGTPWDAAAIELIVSKTGPQPSYQTINRWPLRPAG
jgi:2'-5' RNA ligase